jgi:hypothetical protein
MRYDRLIVLMRAGAMLNIRPSLIVLLAALYLGGCAHSADKTAGTHKEETPKTVGPGNTPKSHGGPAASEISKFWFESPYEPKGKRVWTKVGPDKWDERTSDGNVNHYIGSDRFDMGGYHGIVVRGGPDDLNILIPDGGKGAYVRFR